MKIGLIGNQNSGKTTLFNSLTGSTAHVGNWPGVTVDKKEGTYKKLQEEIAIIDLPGIYSLSPYTPEEIISRNYILEEKPDALIVSGDIFHTSTPSVMSQRLYYHALVELSRLYDDLQIIVTAGNHDSPSRLEAPRELWEAFDVTVVGNLDFYKEVQERYLQKNIQFDQKDASFFLPWIQFQKLCCLILFQFEAYLLHLLLD